MHCSYHCRWLPAVVLAAVFPAALVAQSAFRGSSEDSETAATTVPDIPTTPPAVEPQVQLSHQEMGDLYIVRHRYQAAIREFKQVEPHTAAAWNGMGVAYQMLYDTKDAIRCYQESVRLNHRNLHALNNLATTYDSMKDYSKAERYYRKALKVDSCSALLLKNLATNLMMQHKYEKAQKLYLRALAIDPEILSDDRGNPATQSVASIHDLGAANYFKARSCARAGIIDCALENLRMAINEGVAKSKMIAQEPDFDAIRNTPDFQSLMAIAD